MRPRVSMIPPNSRLQARKSMTTPPPEVITVDKHRIACDGGGGALGHPKVFLEMGSETSVECPYCDRKFVLSKQAAEAGHH